MNSKMKIISTPLAGCESVEILPFGELTAEEKEKFIEKPHIHVYKFPNKEPEFLWDSSNKFHYVPTSEDINLLAEAMVELVKESKKPVRLIKAFANRHYDEETLKKCILV